ncbi:MAG: Crp/Fnr family transcriptional regulator [Muribaculaceae bacterium]
MDVKILMSTPVFLHLNQEKLQGFIENAAHRLRTYGVHDFIAMQGDPCRSLFLLYSGQVRTVMSGPDGKQIIMSDLKAPILLAPAFIFATNNHFPVSVVAGAPCEVLIINKENFIELMRREPIIMQNFMRIISDRSCQLTRKISDFALYSLKGRVATYLCRFGSIRNQNEVAARMGVARPSLSRVLAELATEGCIAFEKRRVVIVNRSYLEKYL